MSEELLPNVLTPIDPEDLADALVHAWRNLLGTTPARESILLLLAQSAHETGRWKSAHCFNIGNVKGRAGDGRDYTQFRCWELVNGVKMWFDPPHPATRFRAFRSLAEGTVDYLGVLRGRYASAWPAIEAGDPLAFVHLLKVKGYFTDTEENYAKGVVSFVDLYRAQLHFEVRPENDVALDDAMKAQIAGQVALSLRDLAIDADDAARADVDPDASPDDVA
jgi:hypothetical protein